MRAYKVVDAFSDQPLKGNPVAVILDAEGLSDAEMQAIARWTNLSETTFLLPSTNPEADYRLRIFTPKTELPFAGHPTLGSAHAVMEAGRIAPRDGLLVQECAKGLIRIAVEDDGYSRQIVLDMPKAEVSLLAEDDVVELEAILGAKISRAAPPAKINVGPVWIVAQLASAEAVLDLTPDYARSIRFERRVGAGGVSVFGNYPQGAEAAIEVRSFAPSDGIEEDPVCGSGNGSIAAFRSLHGQIPGNGGSYVATQGRKVGRDGRIAVTVTSDGVVKIGGACVTCVDGTLRY